ncbi:UDP-2,3-diacylglucosamine diphosphatase [Aquisalimonas lutea]|uniref:UDP-2,3-diacylglucosamine diphosphatase n=1 Tax=Aquisalimonas lutea TaxID=1327750 RepID=UPI0025B4D372|nr:UDP-2,3-diacylglucosamine diphosphatase [Aquisalimonas lutea]MDN3518815.1 UDP-2,3-diacylglucosamine diphosphatase [Aquisalimonas lutea]
MLPTVFIADLHLDERRPRIVQLFLQFLQETAGRADALYILGDLFEAWIGDDAVPADHPVLAGLRAFAATGTPLYVMRGNRDFLLGEGFAEATGARMLDDPTVIRLGDEPVLLMHGDLLCTDDRDYQQFRAMVHDPAWQREFLARSVEERLALAREARDESTSHTSALAGGSEAIMDVNPDAVRETMREHGVQRLIHGHTHRPDTHTFELDGRPATRIVLGDWFEQGSVLRYQDGDYQLREIPVG